MLRIIPISRDAALRFLDSHHRHHGRPPGYIVSVGVEHDGALCGVAFVARPVARLLQDGYTAEVTRLCTDGTPNACSILYGATRRATKALGYRRLVTYTLPEEGGASLRASGWRCAGRAGGGSWSRPSRRREDKAPTATKLRWEATL